MARTILNALAGGAAGALTLTARHEILKRVSPEAPRLDRLGQEAIQKAASWIGVQPGRKALYRSALAGDVVANTGYYSLAGLAGRKHALWLGTALGLAAGIGAVLLPGPLGMNERHTRRTPDTIALTLFLYTASGLAAASIFRKLEDR
jgi:hypothetical protein